MSGEELTKIEYFVKKPDKGMHSEMHALAKEISEYCKEPKKFGMYLGIIKNMGLSRAYQVFAELKQGKDIKTPGKLFLYLSSYRKAKVLGTMANSKTEKNKFRVNKKPLRAGSRKQKTRNGLATGQ